MTRCSGHFHTQVPVTFVTCLMSYCHQCRAWTVDLQMSCQTSDDEPHRILHRRIELGPFDDQGDALNYVIGFHDDALALPGSPWVSGDTYWDYDRRSLAAAARRLAVGDEGDQHGRDEPQ